MKNITLVLLVALLLVVYNIPSKKYARFIPDMVKTETIVQMEPVSVSFATEDYEFADFKREIITNDGVENNYFFIMIGASWCEPCKRLKEAIIRMKPSVKIVYLDYDELTKDQVWHPYLFKNRPKVVPQLLRLRATKTKGTWEKLYWGSDKQLGEFLK